MFRRPNQIALDLGPVDALVQFLVDQPHQNDLTPVQNVRSVHHLSTCFFILVPSHNTLHGLGEDDVGDVIVTFEYANHGAAVGGDDADALYRELDVLVPGVQLAMPERVAGEEFSRRSLGSCSA